MQHIGGEEECLQGLVGEPEGRRPFGRPRHRWEDNINMDLKEIGGRLWPGWSWLSIGTSGGFLGSTVMNLCVPHNVGKFLTSFSRTLFSEVS
jgi:hypothetical protein